MSVPFFLGDKEPCSFILFLQSFPDELSNYESESILKDHAFFFSPDTSSTSSQDPVTLQSKVNDLEAEVAKLREQLGTAKGVNDMMWENVVQRVIRKSNEGAPIDVDDDGDATRRKRQRGRG